MKTLFKNAIAILILVGGWYLVFGTSSYEYEKSNVSIELKYSEPIVKEVTEDNELPCFYETLGYYESRGRYHIVNSSGYLGKYQFGMKTLKWIGFNVSRTEFLNNPTLQEKAVRKYVSVNRKLLKPYIQKYANHYFTTYDGKKIFVTESGILGGAHLGGHGNVKKFFDTNGRVNRADANGTSVCQYIETFSKTQI